MTIEKEFFEAFGIEPKCQSQDKCDYLNKFGWAFNYYPLITPEIVLGLEEIMIKHTFAYINMEGRKIVEHKIGKGKTRIEALLNLCIQLKDEIQDQVKALFINKQNGVTNE